MKKTIFALAAIVCSMYALNASAAVTINISEVGGNVEATVSGSINLAATQGLVGNGGTSFNAVHPALGAFSVGFPLISIYDVDIPSWTPFGAGPYQIWNNISGDGVSLYLGDLGLPRFYVSGTPISATATKTAATLASMGMTEGVYVSTITNGGVTDTITVIVGDSAPPPPPPPTSATPVPTLGTYGLILTILGLFGVAVRRLSRKSGKEG